MKKYSLSLTNIVISIIASLLISQSSLAATVEMNWVEPGTYDDMRSGDQNRKAFRDRTFKVLEKHFIKLAANLPKNQILKVDILNIDLAGEIDFSGERQIRILREPYFPRINLAYQLMGDDNAIVMSGSDKLKSMNFLQSSNLRYRNESLGHEKKMLDVWFNGTFVSLVKTHK
jgi:hypothetical protein